MKFKYILLLVPLLCMLSCSRKESTNTSSSNEISSISTVDQNKEDYGVFLGLDDSKEAIAKMVNYNEVALEIESFSKESIQSLKEAGVQLDAYLSVGSLEKYKSYYNEFKEFTFMDYDNWPDERWINTSEKSWQNKLKELAEEYKSLGADALFLDNYDVYYVACELYKDEDIKDEIYQGLIEITDELYKLDMKLIFNSGIDFLYRIKKENPDTLKKVHALNQESVFSSIEDYDKDIFSKQNEEDHLYYIDAIEAMSSCGLNIYLLEYTKDEALKQEIISYCNKNNYKYYISSSVGLY